MRQGLRLWADCYGSQTYQVSATLNREGIAECYCSCPYDWGGICKHEVALLLTFIHQQEAFQVIPPLPEMLAAQSRANLIDLIERMIQRYPDILSLVQLSAAEAETGSQPLNLSLYQRQAQRAFNQDECEEIARDLSTCAKLILLGCAPLRGAHPKICVTNFA